MTQLHIRHSKSFLACSKRSDSGERCEVKIAMKSSSPPHLPPRPSLAFIFSRSFFVRTAPHYLNAWNRLNHFVPVSRHWFPRTKFEQLLSAEQDSFLLFIKDAI